MRLLLPLLLLLPACVEEAAGPDPTDRVDLVLWTVACEPDEAPEDRFFHAASSLDWHIGWTLPCVRDGGTVDWMAVKVSRWEDRAEDVWNLWFVDPAQDEVRYGDPDVAGVPDAQNTDYPRAWERVPPVTPLPEGDYRVEVWAVVGDSLDAQRNEVRLTVLP